MARLNERNDWFDLWFEDKQAMMGTMMRNMAADLAAGYNYLVQALPNSAARSSGTRRSLMKRWKRSREWMNRL